MKGRNNSHRGGVLIGLCLLIGAHLLLRWVMTRSPFLAESYYDEAVTGEMALHILKGQHQLFFWGQPYMGALEAYLNAVIILLIGPSALALRLSDTLVSVFMLFLMNRIGTLVGDWKVGLLSAAYWALGPLYLSIIGLLATGGHIEACVFGAFILLSLSWLIFKSPQNPALLSGLIGLMAGLAWWSSLLAAPFLLAGVLVLAIARPRLLLTRIPVVGLAGFLLGSFPFWLWEFFHDFSTFGFFEGHGVGIFRQLGTGLYTVLRFSLFQSFLGDWWDGHTVLPSVPSILAWAVFVLIYLPILFIALATVFQWFRRILSFRNPFRETKDLIVAAFWILVLSFATSEQGANGSLRYSFSLYVPATILVGLWLEKIFRLRQALGATVLIGLLGFNLFLHYLFFDQFKNLPYRPVDALIKALKDHGIRYAYADNRISQVLTFESGESIICADYYGQRNFEFLRMVDAAPAAQVAIVTHRKLGNPYPETMAAMLKLLGGSSKRAESGDYVFWYDFKEPSEPLNPLSATDWQITSSQGQNQVDWLRDRDIFTSWSILQRSGDYLCIDLGHPKWITRISLLPGFFGVGLPNGFKLEASLDGKKWDKISEMGANDMMGGLCWFRGRPRLEQNSRLQISFVPHRARYVRLTNLALPETPKSLWTIAELFIYETAGSPEGPSKEAQQNFHQAEQTLDRWMDDPTGPHPLFPGSDLKSRRRQVHWERVIRFAQQAIQEAPDWEEPHILFGEAVDWGGLANRDRKPEKSKKVILETLFPPTDGLRLSSARFQATSNVNPAQTGLAVDGDPSTRWTSLKAQEPGMFFQVNLDGLYPVKGFSLFLTNALNDYPRRLEIYGSLDGERWQAIPADLGSSYAFAGHGLYKKTDYRFPPVPLRYLKLIQKGSDPTFWWSIYELDLFEEKSLISGKSKK
jgi:hypothetical protein